MSSPSFSAPALQDSFLTLGSRLTEALEQEPDAQKVLQQVLCNADISPRLPNSVLAWMRDYPTLQGLHEELVRQKSDQGPVLATPMALGPLLAWASNQSWADRVAWTHYCAAWPRALCNQGPVHSLAAVEHALQIFRPSIQTLHPARRAFILHSWLQVACLWEDPRWAPDARPYLARIWIFLAQWSQLTPPDTTLPVPNAIDRWAAQVKKSLYGMDIWYQQAMVQDFLASDLEGPTIRLAVCSGDPESLNTPHITTQLLALMPAAEADRVAMLPWCVPVGSATPSGSHQTYMVGEACRLNSALVRTYCPVLHGLLDCIVDKNDWADKNKILTLVQSMVSATAQDSTPLPEQWEEA